MDTYLRDSLTKLGITPENHRALLLLPLVYVAWADGKMEDVEVERIDAIAKHKLFIGPEGLRVLDEWLSKAPEKELFVHGLEELFLQA
jgi:uncharacterized tellurite resistance protein B-like protein